jgi:hypothetical protein
MVALVHRSTGPRQHSDVMTARLASTLRACAVSARHFGASNAWRPGAGSAEAEVWDRVPGDPVATALCEADVHAVVLLQSGLDHTEAAARAMGARSAFLPHTIGRTAAEHLSRAQHLLDPGAAQEERVDRRLNELAYAIDEGSQRRDSIVRHGHIAADDAGVDRAELLQDLDNRAASLGREILRTKRGRPYVAGTDGRASSMNLLETYTAGGAIGIPSFTNRGASAVLHGTELGLLHCTKDDPRAHATNPRVHVPISAPMEVPNLAFSMLSVLLTVLNATEAAADRLGWPRETKAHLVHARDSDRAQDVWARILEHDVEPSVDF